MKKILKLAKYFDRKYAKGMDIYEDYEERQRNDIARVVNEAKKLWSRRNEVLNSLENPADRNKADMNLKKILNASQHLTQTATREGMGSVFAEKYKQELMAAVNNLYSVIDIYENPDILGPMERALRLFKPRQLTQRMIERSPEGSAKKAPVMEEEMLPDDFSLIDPELTGTKYTLHGIKRGPLGGAIPRGVEDFSLMAPPIIPGEDY